VSRDLAEVVADDPALSDSYGADSRRLTGGVEDLVLED